MAEKKTVIRAILTGATGMVGEGVLFECLNHATVENILVIGRKTCGISHPKLNEIIIPDFNDLSAIESQVENYNTCFFCLGVSSVGLSEADYYKLTYELTINFAKTLSKINTGMTFCYISGSGTDSTENGKIMWARVKGKTENDLKKLNFKSVYNFRPGVLQPTKGLQNTLSFYKWAGWLLPIIKLMAPGYISTLRELGISMITAASYGYEKQTIEVKDIKILSKLESDK